MKPAIAVPTAKMGEGQADWRQAAALEFIAYYLDRIDGHLEKLAAQAQGSGEAVGRLSADFRGAAIALGNIAQSVGTISHKK